MGNVNIKQLEKESAELFALIDSANRSLQLPASSAKESFEAGLQQFVSKAGPKLAVQFQKAISSGRIESAILGGVIVGTAYGGAVAYDAARNALAHNKAKNALLGYYQELTVKQNLIISELYENTKKYAELAAIHSAEASRLKKRCDELESLAQKIIQFQKKIQG